jgi:hypothetical protein
MHYGTATSRTDPDEPGFDRGVTKRLRCSMQTVYEDDKGSGTELKRHNVLRRTEERMFKLKLKENLYRPLFYEFLKLFVPLHPCLWFHLRWCL